jgi:hypothetical protein
MVKSITLKDVRQPKKSDREKLIERFAKWVSRWRIDLLPFEPVVFPDTCVRIFDYYGESMPSGRKCTFRGDLSSERIRNLARGSKHWGIKIMVWSATHHPILTFDDGWNTYSVIPFWVELIEEIKRGER